MFVFRVLYLGGLLLLAACSTSSPPRVVERGLSESPAYHVVRAGDTVYAISLRYERDYRELARINQLPDDYRIFPGQRIYLNALPAALAKPPASKSPAVAKPAAVLPPPLAAVPPKPVPPKPAPSAPPAPAPSRPSSEPSVGKPTAPVAVVQPPASIISWTWPASGPVIRRFSDSGVGSKGLDIAGKQGDPVLAAAGGTVVYVGTGLVGYGKLIILRHNNNYLSAYAHNDRFLVKEGDVVKLGQKIAEMGSSGADREKLHFEIRHQGKPVDPLQYLPSR